MKERGAVMERDGIHLEEMSDEEEDSIEELEPREEVDPVRFFMLVVAVSSRPQLEMLMYDWSLNAKELFIWINRLDKYFSYEEFDEAKKVKFAVMKLKGNASIYWDGVQANKRRKGKHKIKSWSKMVAKLNGNLLPKYYQFSLFREMWSLKQKQLSVKEYTT